MAAWGGCTDELAAAAAVLATSVDDYAESDLEQRTSCAAPSGDNGSGAALDVIAVNEETKVGHAAVQEVDDASLKVLLAL